MKIGLFGTGAYGMALSSILVENNCEVVLWTKFEEEKKARQESQETQAKQEEKKVQDAEDKVKNSCQTLHYHQKRK